LVAGTLRALDPDTRKTLHDEVRRTAERIAEAHRLQARVALELGPPPIVNRKASVDWVRQAVTALLGAAALVPLGNLNMAAEDFAFYLEDRQGCFFRIGACEEGGDFIPVHTPRFYAADESIFVGAAVLAESARVAAARLAAS
jgi:hippurate hydrolase